MIIVRGIPLYWGVERDAVDRTFLTRATLDEVLPPYRRSHGRAVRIRVSPWHWLHIGLYEYQLDLNPWGLHASPDEIGGWGAKEEDEADDAADELGAVGSFERDGLVPGPGGSIAENGGTISWAGAPGDRPRLDPERDEVAGGAGVSGDTGVAAQG